MKTQRKRILAMATSLLFLAAPALAQAPYRAMSAPAYAASQIPSGMPAYLPAGSAIQQASYGCDSCGGGGCGACMGPPVAGGFRLTNLHHATPSAPPACETGTCGPMPGGSCATGACGPGGGMLGAGMGGMLGGMGGMQSGGYGGFATMAHGQQTDLSVVAVAVRRSGMTFTLKRCTYEEMKWATTWI